MKTLIIILSLSSTLVGSPIPEFPFIYVKGQASEDVSTNLATIRFDVVKNSRVSEQGESALSEASKAIRKALRDLGIKDKDINASEVSKREEYGEFPQFQKKIEPVDPTQLPPLDGPDESDQTKSKEAYYSLRQQFIIQINELKLYPDLARHLMRSGDVSRYDVEFSATNRKEVIDKLRRAAFADAKRAALEIAEASGERLGRIHSASEMPYSELSQLVGEDPRSGIMYSASFAEDKIYEVPPTVPESFGVFVLFRLAPDKDPKSEQGMTPNGP